MKELIRGEFVFSLMESFLAAHVLPEIKYSSDVSIRELHLSHSAKDKKKKKAANVNGLIRNYRVHTVCFLSASFFQMNVTPLEI